MFSEDFAWKAAAINISAAVFKENFKGLFHFTQCFFRIVSSLFYAIIEDALILMLANLEIVDLGVVHCLYFQGKS